MKRRDVLKMAAVTGLLTAAGSPQSILAGASSTSAAGKLIPPSKGKIPVAFVISDGATVIDFAGPWEVFQDVHVKTRGSTMDEQMPFSLFTVSNSLESIRASAGLRILPDYTFAAAPEPKVVVVPAQRGHSAEMFAWLRKMSESADVIMSVCTGAFLLGAAGLLSGKSATTHHDYYDRFAQAFPDVQLKRGLRFVEGVKISTAGGLTSGIDLALRVVERYFGREVAEATATYMEYQGTGWKI